VELSGQIDQKSKQRDEGGDQMSNVDFRRLTNEIVNIQKEHSQIRKTMNSTIGNFYMFVSGYMTTPISKNVRKINLDLEKKFTYQLAISRSITSWFIDNWLVQIIFNYPTVLGMFILLSTDKELTLAKLLASGFAFSQVYQIYQNCQTTKNFWPFLSTTLMTGNQLALTGLLTLNNFVDLRQTCFKFIHYPKRAFNFLKEKYYNVLSITPLNISQVLDTTIQLMIFRYFFNLGKIGILTLLNIPLGTPETLSPSWKFVQATVSDIEQVITPRESDWWFFVFKLVQFGLSRPFSEKDIEQLKRREIGTMPMQINVLLRTITEMFVFYPLITDILPRMNILPESTFLTPNFLYYLPVYLYPFFSLGNVFIARYRGGDKRRALPNWMRTLEILTLTSSFFAVCLGGPQYNPEIFMFGTSDEFKFSVRANMTKFALRLEESWKTDLTNVSIAPNIEIITSLETSAVANIKTALTNTMKDLSLNLPFSLLFSYPSKRLFLLFVTTNIIIIAEHLIKRCKLANCEKSIIRFNVPVPVPKKLDLYIPGMELRSGKTIRALSPLKPRTRNLSDSEPLVSCLKQSLGVEITSDINIIQELREKIQFLQTLLLEWHFDDENFDEFENLLKFDLTLLQIIPLIKIEE